MTNTKMSAKNSFLEGLVLDISPENMSATSMSSALNATLLTFNGNEMTLQNDMGNGRVETAFLPEGYIPVGTCEFGDIIYIVSYNPLLNKSQIGCFPSPERNISTEEIGGLKQSLNWTDFLKGDEKPNGKLKTTSVKKILYDNRNMTPGDKYIIYSSALQEIDNSKYLSDYGNTSKKHDSFPKLVKIHVVSIEESGKIVYLDSTTRWYDNKQGDYYLSDKALNTLGKIDLDSYRDLLSSGYSIFSSKISGKLALLIELEKITGFSCAWEAYSNEITLDNNIENTNYSIYMHYNWTTEHNDINLSGVSLLTSEWVKKGEKNYNIHLGDYWLWSQTVKDGEPLLSLTTRENLGTDVLPLITENGYYGNKFTRHYEQESGITYNEYISKYAYDKVIEGMKDYYKININKDNGIPIISEYLVNCVKVIYDKSTKSYKYLDNKNLEIFPNNKIDDSIVNNYFHYPVIKHFYDFSIPTRLKFNINGKEVYKEPDITNLIYHYKIAPTMPYGILEEYAQEGYIDFSKIGKKHIDLNTWKYYNYENTSTLTWGMEAYTEPNKGIQEIVFEFYDNNGFVAAYHTKDKLSYNGVFTEYITLNESGTNYKLNNVKAFAKDSEGKPAPSYHKGMKVIKETAVPGFKYTKDGVTWLNYSELEDDVEYFMDDSGTLYSNCLYLVKIIIKYCNKNILDEYIDLTNEDDALVYYRWYWTNNMFNEYYYLEKDFSNLLATLNLDVDAIYYLKNENSLSKTVKYENPTSSESTKINHNEYLQLRANVTYINQDGNSDEDGNLACKLRVGLLNTYNTFNIKANTEGVEDCPLANIEVVTHLGKSYLNNDSYETITNEELGYIFKGVYPTNMVDLDLNDSSKCTGKASELLGKNLHTLLGKEGVGTENEINFSEDAYLDYENTFALKFATNEGTPNSSNLNYVLNYGDCPEEGIPVESIKSDLSKLEYTYGDSELSFTLSGILYSKFYPLKGTLTTEANVVRPLLQTELDADKYNLVFDVDDGHFYFKNLGGLQLSNDENGKEENYIRMYRAEADEKSHLWTDMGSDLGNTKKEKIDASCVDIFKEFLYTKDNGSLYDIFPGITPFIFIKSGDHGSLYKLLQGHVKLVNNKGFDDLATVSSIKEVWSEYYGGMLFGGNKYLEGIETNMHNINGINNVVFFTLADSENYVHILNTFMPVRYSSSEKDGYWLSQEIRKRNGETLTYLSGVYMGDIIASLLMNLYYTEGGTEKITYQGDSNFVKLSPHNYTFTKDIIHQLYVSEDFNHNELLVMNSFSYTDYLDSVVDSLNDSDLANKLINSTDVNIKIESVLKNCPLLVQYPYIDPLQEVIINPLYTIQCSDGRIEYSSLGFAPGKIYCESTEIPGVFNRIDSMQVLKYFNLKDFSVNDVGVYIGVKDNNDLIENSDFKKSFIISGGMLRCLKTSSAQATTANSYTVSGRLKGQGWGNVWPVYKNEVLFAPGKLN